MKKLRFLFIGIFSMSSIYAQDISDALRYSQNEIQGTARFRALSGAFGALGGDMSAISLNPAGSAVFSQSHLSITLSNIDTKNETQYFNGFSTSNNSDFDINQGGAVFVFSSNSGSPWRKFTIGVAYDKTNAHDDYWFASGTNTNDDGQFSNSIASYFYDYADGKRLDEISILPGESATEAYREIGDIYGFAHQQAFLGFESFILDPEDINDDANTIYYSNVSPGNFDHNYSYFARGYNGKVTFNAATQYEDNLYLGVNLNSHFINYERSTLLLEDNTNVGSLVDYIEFENNLFTRGNGFSFQIGGILKLSSAFRMGLTYDSPIWYNIDEETSQYVASDGVDGFNEINPLVINIYPRYKLQTPAKFTGSLAYVFAKQGLISFDYSIKDYSKTEFKPGRDFNDLNNDINNVLTTASTYRIGGEYKLKQFSFRGGYRFEESPYTNGNTIGDLTGYSVGLGINFGNTRLDLTYDQSNRTNRTPLFSSGLIDTASIDRRNSTFTASFGFNI